VNQSISKGPQQSRRQREFWKNQDRRLFPSVPEPDRLVNDASNTGHPASRHDWLPLRSGSPPISFRPEITQHKLDVIYLAGEKPSERRDVDRLSVALSDHGVAIAVSSNSVRNRREFVHRQIGFRPSTCDVKLCGRAGHQ
jgi:hypothetical protein